VSVFAGLDGLISKDSGTWLGLKCPGCELIVVNHVLSSSDRHPPFDFPVVVCYPHLSSSFADSQTSSFR
jgi:hypothetical protein